MMLCPSAGSRGHSHHSSSSIPHPARPERMRTPSPNDSRRSSPKWSPPRGLLRGRPSSAGYAGPSTPARERQRAPWPVRSGALSNQQRWEHFLRTPPKQVSVSALPNQTYHRLQPAVPRHDWIQNQETASSSGMLLTNVSLLRSLLLLCPLCRA